MGTHVFFWDSTRLAELLPVSGCPVSCLSSDFPPVQGSALAERPHCSASLQVAFRQLPNRPAGRRRGVCGTSGKAASGAQASGRELPCPLPHSLLLPALMTAGNGGGGDTGSRASLTGEVNPDPSPLWIEAWSICTVSHYDDAKYVFPGKLDFRKSVHALGFLVGCSQESFRV